MVQDLNKEVLVLGECLAEETLHVLVALTLGLERVLAQLLASEWPLRLVQLLEVIRQALVHMLEELLALFAESGEEFVVSVAAAVLVAPVHDPVLLATRESLLEALEELAALHVGDVSRGQQVETPVFVVLFAAGRLIGQVVHKSVNCEREHDQASKQNVASLLHLTHVFFFYFIKYLIKKVESFSKLNL